MAVAVSVFVRLRERPVEAATIPVTRGEFQEILETRGDIRPVRSVVVTAPFQAGELLILELATTGTAVKKGDPVAKFDALTLLHNETSTGTMSPLAGIAALKKKYPDVMFIVDAVSSLSATRIPFDDLGIDLLLAGSQKALALPPGLALFTCSAQAKKKAAQQKDRGYYFDILEFQKNAEGNMTPSTPGILRRDRRTSSSLFWTPACCTTIPTCRAPGSAGACCQPQNRMPQRKSNKTPSAAAATKAMERRSGDKAICPLEALQFR